MFQLQEMLLQHRTDLSLPREMHFEHVRLGRGAREDCWAELGLAFLYSPGLKRVDLYLDMELQLDSYFECIYSPQEFFHK